jgi:hypothetical protein
MCPSLTGLGHYAGHGYNLCPPAALRRQIWAGVSDTRAGSRTQPTVTMSAGPVSLHAPWNTHPRHTAVCGLITPCTTSAGGRLSSEHCARRFYCVGRGEAHRPPSCQHRLSNPLWILELSLRVQTRGGVQEPVVTLAPGGQLFHKSSQGTVSCLG